MQRQNAITRRGILRAGLGGACCVAASPLMTPVLLAAAPGENRLVVIILRGGLDGLGIVQPYGAPQWSALRPSLATRQPGPQLHDLDGFFGLDAAFGALMPLWSAGELGFVQAVSTPYRNKRSHFDGQDMLETGGDDPDGNVHGQTDGWLNRALGLIPGARAETAIAVGTERLRLLAGSAPARSWSPTGESNLIEDERQLLSRLYADEPLFAEALHQAADLINITDDQNPARRETPQSLAQFTAGMLNEESRIAAFSLGGWDTHRNQAQGLARAGAALVDALLSLRAGLGKNWRQTSVLVMTEFGRTVRENGNRGTDHGTGGIMILAGGAMRGGKIHGLWPGLAPDALYQERDLMPTGDVRRHAGWVLAALFGLSRDAITRTVFPGLDMGADPGIIA